MQNISVHNSVSELQVTEKTIDDLGYEKLIFTALDGFTLPYRRLIVNPHLHGDFSVMIFLHGAGSVGEDNFLQMRVPGVPFARYAAARGLKTVLLFPQCRVGHRWVEVNWGDPAHDIPETPSVHMKAAMELLDSETARFKADPGKIYVGGISMGGYGAWDMASRMPGRFAAIMALCGGGDVKQASKLSDLAVCDYHGTLDRVVPVSRSRDMIEALRLAGNDQLFYREIPDAEHNVWDAAFGDDAALDFIFSHSR